MNNVLRMILNLDVRVVVSIAGVVVDDTVGTIVGPAEKEKTL